MSSNVRLLTLLSLRLRISAIPTAFSATFWHLSLCQSWQRYHFSQPKTVKTIQDLIDTEQGLPMTAKNVIVTIPRASRIYFKPKIHKPNNPGRPIISACSCRTELNSSYLDRIMVPMSLNLYHHTSKILTTHWKFFSISIFLTKQTYYYYGHYFFIYRNSR